jgi:hypothetical protein
MTSRFRRHLAWASASLVFGLFLIYLGKPPMVGGFLLWSLPFGGSSLSSCFGGTFGTTHPLVRVAREI